MADDGQASSSSCEKGISDVFKSYGEEIQRRAGAKEMSYGHSETTTFERAEDDGRDDPYLNPEHRYVLFSLSHREFAPVCQDAKNPAVCIYGTFETRELACEHASVVRKNNPCVSLLIDDTHKWICAVSSVSRLSDLEYCDMHRERVLSDHADRLRANKDDFSRNVRERRMGDVSTPVEAQEGESTPLATSLSEGKIEIATRMSESCRVVDQSMCIVSFLKDNLSNSSEFLFRVYACYDNESNANRHIRNVVGDMVKDHDIDVVRTACWIHPYKMDAKHVKKEIYRSSELHKVMKAHKNAPDQVSRFYSEHPEARSYESSGGIEEVTNVASSSAQDDQTADGASSEKNAEETTDKAPRDE